MLRRRVSRHVAPGASWPQLPLPLSQRRHAGKNFTLSALNPLGNSVQLAENIKSRRRGLSDEMVAAMKEVQVSDSVQYRKSDTPWDLVPRYKKKRVTDLVGILTSEHRMEIELMIEKAQPISDIEMYVVIVPTVGFTDPKIFTNSLFFNWMIGEPRGNGVLLVIAQGELNIQLQSSPGIEKYFSQRVADLMIEDVFQPALVEQGGSYAVLQLCYAVCRHAHEFRNEWNKSIVPLPVRNKVRYSQRFLSHGMLRTWYFWGTLVCALLTGTMLVQIEDALCPDCGAFMLRVHDQQLREEIFDSGQRVEDRKGCVEYRVMKCPKCKKGKAQRIRQLFRNSEDCLFCEKCKYHCMSVVKTIEKLATKTEDGVKRVVHHCDHCDETKEAVLPLFRPVDVDHKEWYEFLLDGAQAPETKGLRRTDLSAGS